MSNSSLHQSRPGQLALTALRLVSGLAFLAHGLIKVAGFPAGVAPGVQPLFSLFGIGGLIEIVTGVLLIVGFLTRPAALIASGQMAVAYFMFHAPASFFPAVNGGEPAMLFSFVFLYFAAVGAGDYGLDAVIAGKPVANRSNLGSLAA